MTRQVGSQHLLSLYRSTSICLEIAVITLEPPRYRLSPIADGYYITIYSLLKELNNLNAYRYSQLTQHDYSAVIFFIGINTSRLSDSGETILLKLL